MCGVSEEMHERNELPGDLNMTGERWKGRTRDKGSEVPGQMSPVS